MCEIVSIGAGGLAVLALIGQVSAGHIVNRRQSEELEKLRLTRFDRFNREEFCKRIRGKPKMRVELLYQWGDVDSYMLCSAVKGCLAAEGWICADPRPIREEDVGFSQINKNAPISVRAGLGLGSVSVITQTLHPNDFNDPVHVLLSAFNVARAKRGEQASLAWGNSTDPTMPDDVIRLIIGPKYHDW